MTAVPSQAPTERRGWRWLQVREMWASLAIAVMWIAVTVDALYGPDIIASNAGANFTRIPSAVVVAFFVCLATRWVARYGLAAR